jgi:hypothetical protein
MDLALLVLGWSAVLLGPWIKYAQLGAPYSVETFFLCASMPIAFMAPSFLLGVISGTRPRHSPLVKRSVLLLAGLSSFLSVMLFAMAYAGLAGLDANTAKSLYASQQVEPVKIYWRLALLLAPAIPLFLFGALQRAKEQSWRIILIVFLVWVGSILSSRFGARYDFLCFLTMVIAGSCWMYSSYILANKLRVALFAFIGVVCFVAANVVISFFRNAPAASMNEYQSVLADGQVVLSGIGMPQLPDAAAYAAGVLDDYVLSNVSRFEIYADGHREEPAYGQVMFYIPAQQLGWDEGAEIKRAVDDMYRVLGVTVNIWATGVRDVHMDFGLLGSFCFVFVCGVGYAFCNKAAEFSVLAGVCGVMLLAFAVFLPFGSLWKSPFLQVGFLVWLGGFAFDAISNQVLTKAICNSASSQ